MKLTLVKKLEEARGTKSFFFESEEKVIWNAGQYIYITLPKLNYEDERGFTRHFTISSSPTEGDLVRITTRMRQESGYKKTLDELPIGTITEGKGPEGTFLFDPKNKNKQSLLLRSNVFIAGGIGITPFRSILKNIIDSKVKTNIHLVYSNSDSDFVFKSELDKWQKENENFKVSYFDSSVSGHLDTTKLSGMLKAYDLKHIAIYVVGPNKFVYAMEEILEKLKVKAENIKAEKFIGY